MKKTLPLEAIKAYIDDAVAGLGREVEIGGGNTRVDITILGSDLATCPELVHFAGGTVRVYLNRKGKYVGHKVVGPARRHHALR
jgi:hypothetical protein